MDVYTPSYSHRIIKDSEACHIYRLVKVSATQVTNGADTVLSVQDSFKPGDIKLVALPDGSKTLVLVQGDYTLRTLTSKEHARFIESSQNNGNS